SVLERHLYCVGLDGGDIRQLTSEPGWHETQISPDFNRFVDWWSNTERAPSVVLQDMDGNSEAVLFDQPDVMLTALGLQSPEFIKLSTRDGVELNAAVYVPPEIEPGKRYPLVVSVYGGPHAQMVTN